MNNPDAGTTSFVGAVTVADSPFKPRRPHIFVKDLGPDVWCRWSDGNAWYWKNMHSPDGVAVAKTVGAVTVMDDPNSPQRAHVFMVGSDSNVWCLFSNTQKWDWRNLQKPSASPIRLSLGVATMTNSATSAQRAHVFVETEDRNVWCCYWDGNAWRWAPMPKLDTTIRASMGAVVARDNPTAKQRPHVFVQGDDLAIWCLWTDGDAWQWLKMGTPSGLSSSILSPMGVVSVMDSPDSPQRPYVFMMSPDGNLWCRWSDGSQWRWTNHEKPAATIRGSMGAIAVRDTAYSPQRIHVFVQDDNGGIWCRWCDNTNAWQKWTPMPKLSGMGNGRFMGAVAVMDTPPAPERGHVFVRSEGDQALWCLWANE